MRKRSCKRKVARLPKSCYNISRSLVITGTRLHRSAISSDERENCDTLQIAIIILPRSLRIAFSFSSIVVLQIKNFNFA